MKNTDYQPPRPAIAPDPELVGDEGTLGDPGSDDGLPYGWTYEHVCDVCNGPVRRPADDGSWYDLCSPGCEEEAARNGQGSTALANRTARMNPMAGAIVQEDFDRDEDDTITKRDPAGGTGEVNEDDDDDDVDRDDDHKGEKEAPPGGGDVDKSRDSRRSAKGDGKAK